MTLQAATSKSACIDIPSPYDMELIELYNPHKIPTGYYGPIAPGTMGLIWGCNSCTMRGLVVLTGVVDEDYEGEIHIMVWESASRPRTREQQTHQGCSCWLAAPAGWQRPQGAPSSEQHCLQSPQKKEEGNARLLASRHRTCEAVKQMRKEVGEGLGD